MAFTSLLKPDGLLLPFLSVSLSVVFCCFTPTCFHSHPVLALLFPACKYVCMHHLNELTIWLRTFNNIGHNSNSNVDEREHKLMTGIWKERNSPCFQCNGFFMKRIHVNFRYVTCAASLLFINFGLRRDCLY